MSVWVWIILPATSGAPHGTADCGKKRQVGTWGGQPSSGLSYIYTHWQGIAANGRPERLRDDPARQMLLWILANMVSSLSPTSCLTDTAYLFPGVRCDCVCLCSVWAAASRSRTLCNVDERSGGLSRRSSVINGLLPELQLPVIWTCHHLQHITTLCSDSVSIATSEEKITRQCSRQTMKGNEKTGVLKESLALSISRKSIHSNLIIDSSWKAFLFFGHHWYYITEYGQMLARASSFIEQH